MVRKSVLLKVGGFSPEFFMNYEETELCNRITRAGFSIYSVPSAQITHLEGRASYIKQSRLYFLYEGQYIYFRKVLWYLWLPIDLCYYPAEKLYSSFSIPFVKQ